MSEAEEPPWGRMRVGVVGLGVAGVPAAVALLERGADVTVFDRSEAEEVVARASELSAMGAHAVLGRPAQPEGLDLLVVSPGVPPDSVDVLRGRECGVPVWGELELAWRLRAPGTAPWLIVSGTNGKTTTTLMLAAILRASGLRTAAIGNIGVSAVEAVASGVPYDALAVEVSASQLVFMHTVAPLAAACLNLAPDHIDYFGSFDAYRAAKARVFRNAQVAAVYNSDDPATLEMASMAPVGGSCRRVGFTLGVPESGMVGVEASRLVDRAFGTGELADVEDIRPAAPHNVSNALAAAALALAASAAPTAVREGLRGFEPAEHRIAAAGTVAGVAYVDDSKATNCHAALTSLLAYPSVVWIAGGLAKGQDFGDLVASAAQRLKGAVLLGQDRAVIAAALARHAPQVPVIQLAETDTGAMGSAVAAAAGLARPGDTVLLAPGCASWDMFDDYAARGRAFTAAVARMGSECRVGTERKGI